ncbi:MAG: glutamate-5-semialdehyde dehydrogenase [Aquiluna sp.]|nr:glutamate-5-semialdehyde dehydrogenase [Aquiluna sp.]MCF8545209.1 glutamate-5-semialdehyde dehydrogenase [Aquiluna sp.]
MSTLDILKLAKDSAPTLASANTNQKNAALEAIASLLVQRESEIIAGNKLDIEAGEKNGLSKGLQDRLKLDSKRINALAAAVREIISLPDPIGDSVSGMTLPNGLKLQQVRVPFGVIGVIYEARPNVTIDIAALAIKSGNAVALRGGTAAENTNKVLVQVLQDGLASAGLPANAVQTVDPFGRDGAVEMMQARGLVDVLIPRGSANLIKTVVTESKVPVIETGDGVVHMFLDESADLDMSISLAVNAKVQRPSVCNALETLLVHEASADRLLPKVATALIESGVTLHGCEQTVAIIKGAVPAIEEDWTAEYYSLDLAVKVVSNLDAALEHIAKYSTHHTESIITNDHENAERFLQEVDSAVVMVNASTRFTDGGEFGFGAEVGISTQKLHARGPMGLRELTSSKWLVRGSGQVRS